MKSFDDGGPLDQLFAKARELAHEAPELRRQKVVDFVMSRIAASGTKEKVARFVVERVYDRIFPMPGLEKDPETNLCPHCGLNDGHHYVGCRALED